VKNNPDKQSAGFYLKQKPTDCVDCGGTRYRPRLFANSPRSEAKTAMDTCYLKTLLLNSLNGGQITSFERVRMFGVRSSVSGTERIRNSKAGQISHLIN